MRVTVGYLAKWQRNEKIFLSEDNVLAVVGNGFTSAKFVKNALKEWDDMKDYILNAFAERLRAS